MQAAIQTAYGAPEVLSLTTLASPTPGPNELLIRVSASAVTAADTLMRQGKPRFSRLFLGVFKPRQLIPGTGFSGAVEAVGKNVSRYAPGDAVMGESVLGGGANCEFVCVDQGSLLVPKPNEISFSAAATVCDGALTAYHFLHTLGRIRAGQRVLVNGAAGSMGSAAVQLAKLSGASVTGVCGTLNLEFVRSLGADEVVDYTSTEAFLPAKNYDIVFDCVGKMAPGQGLNLLAKDGRYLNPVLSLGHLKSVLLTRLLGTKRSLFSATGLLPVERLMPMLGQVVEHLRRDELDLFVDREYRLADIAKAHAYVDTGHKRGNVVLVNESRQHF